MSCRFQKCPFFHMKEKPYCSRHQWTWDRIYLLYNVGLPLEILENILYYLGERSPFYWLSDKDILDCINRELTFQSKWSINLDSFCFPIQERIQFIRSLSPFLFIHCDEIQTASSLLFGDDIPSYLKSDDAIQLMKEINSKFLYTWTKIAFQKLLVQKCFHPNLLPEHHFSIGLCYNTNYFQINNYMSSTQILYSVIKYRPLLLLSN